MNSRQVEGDIDHYRNTALTIIAFMSLCRFDKDSEAERSDVKAFQGRKMSSAQGKELSPDIIIQYAEQSGIVAEVKMSFPMDENHWIDDFHQLMEYDDDLKNWDTDDGAIALYYIVLIVHQSRSVRVEEFYKDGVASGSIQFKRNFFIVESNRSDEAQTYIYLRLKCGIAPDNYDLYNTLHNGIPIPMEKILPKHSMHMIYDAKPPLPYLMFIIWQYFVSNKAFEDPNRDKIRLRGKVSISTSTEEIKAFLSENFSINEFNSHNRAYQPIVPKREWIKEVIDALVILKLGEWVDVKQGNCVIAFKRGLTKEEFIRLCVEHNLYGSDEGQTELFS